MVLQVFTIGEAASRAGVSADTLRYYERQGVLSPSRTSAGYRLYSEETIARIRLIKNAVSFGFAVKQLAVFLRACDAGCPPCQKVRHAGTELLGDMERRIAEMTTARDEMRSLLRRWDRALDMTPTDAPARLLVSIPASRSKATLRRRP
jgi:MerR family transcriptional regulator, Zn(II)-responsive regulator of zntA